LSADDCLEFMIAIKVPRY